MSTPAYLVIQNVVLDENEDEIVADVVAALTGRASAERAKRTRVPVAKKITHEIKLWAAYDDGGDVLRTVAILPIQYWLAAKEDESHRYWLKVAKEDTMFGTGFAAVLGSLIHRGSGGCMQITTGKLAALMCRSVFDRWEPVVSVTREEIERRQSERTAALRSEGLSDVAIAELMAQVDDEDAPSWIVQIVQPESRPFGADDPEFGRKLTPTVRVWSASQPADDAEAALRLSECRKIVAEMNDLLPDDGVSEQYRVYRDGPYSGIEYEFSTIAVRIALAVGNM